MSFLGIWMNVPPKKMFFGLNLEWKHSRQFVMYILPWRMILSQKAHEKLFTYSYPSRKVIFFDKTSKYLSDFQLMLLTPLFKLYLPLTWLLLDRFTESFKLELFVKLLLGGVFTPLYLSGSVYARIFTYFFSGYFQFYVMMFFLAGLSPGVYNPAGFFNFLNYSNLLTQPSKCTFLFSSSSSRSALNPNSQFIEFVSFYNVLSISAQYFLQFIKNYSSPK